MHSDPGVTNAHDVNNGDTPMVTAAGNSYAVCAAAAALSADDFIEVNKKKAKTTKRPQAVPKVLGSSTASNLGVTGVQRRLVAFVSRLHIDTKEQDIIEMLHNAGADKVQCYRVKPKDGKVYQTAAFRVSCDPQSAAIFYNESNWPLGCELRDWIFYKK